MYKKIFSAILFGVLTIASTSTFVSCKDYDDDINNLQAQIDELNNKKIAEINSTITELKNADANLQKAIEDAKTDLQKAITDGDAATLAAAKSLIDKAIEDCQKACKENLAKSQQEQDARYDEAIAKVNQRVDDVIKLLSDQDGNIQQVGKDLKALSDKLANFESQYGSLTTAFTDLTKRVTNLEDAYKAQQAALEKQEAALKDLSSKLSGQPGSNGYDDTALKNDIAGAKTRIDNIEQSVKDLQKALDDKFKEVMDKIGNVNGTVAQNLDDLRAAHENFATKDALRELSDKVSNVKSYAEGVAADLGKLDVMFKILVNDLRGLVYMPKLYIDGIETIEYPYLDYDRLKKNPTPAQTRKEKDDDIPVNLRDLEDYDHATPIDRKAYGPVWPIQYHMNPGNASTEYASIKGYYAYEAEVLTRAFYETKNNAASTWGIVPADRWDNQYTADMIWSKKNGIMTIGLQITNPEGIDNPGVPAGNNHFPTDLKEDSKDGQSPESVKNVILALQANSKKAAADYAGAGKDTVITSDYAQVLMEKVKIEGIIWNTNPGYWKSQNERIKDFWENKKGYNDPAYCPLDGGIAYNYRPGGTSATDGRDEAGDVCGKWVHVWDKPEEALLHPADIELYIDQEVVLSKYLGVHWYFEQNEPLTENVASHKNIQTWKFDSDELRRYGFVWVFDTVDYYVDTNKTRDSRYMRFTDHKTGALVSADITETGATYESTTHTSVGREPLVRVRLYHFSDISDMNKWRNLNTSNTPQKDINDFNNLNAKPVLDGYIRLHITRPEKLEIEYPTENFTFDLCNGNSTPKYGRTNYWDYAMFNARVLKDKLNNMEKEQFDAAYRVELAAGVSAPTGTNRAVEVAQYIQQGAPIAESPNEYYYYKNVTGVAFNNTNWSACQIGQIWTEENVDGVSNHTYWWSIPEDQLEAMTHHAGSPDAGSAPVTITRWIHYTGHFYSSTAPNNATATYDDIFIKLTLTIKRKDVTKVSITEKIRNAWKTYDGKDGDDTNRQSVALNCLYPQDDMSTINWRNDYLDWFVQNYVKLSNSISQKDSKFYFAPREVEIKALNGNVYIVTPRRGSGDNVWNKFMCLYVNGNTHEYKLVANDPFKVDEAKNNDILNQCAIRYQPDAASILAAYNMNVAVPAFATYADEQAWMSKWPKCDGVFSNDTLYAVLKSKYSSQQEYEPIAVITNTTTKDLADAKFGGAPVVYYHEYIENKWLPATNHNTSDPNVGKENVVTEELVNAYGYDVTLPGRGTVLGGNPLDKQVRGFVGVIAKHSCNIATQMSDEISNFAVFQSPWERPINLIKEDTIAVDARNNANYLYAVDLLKLYDWRGPTLGYMWGNQQWLWAYYNVKGITFDCRPSVVLTNLHQTNPSTFVKLNSISTHVHLYAGGLDATDALEIGGASRYTAKFDLRTAPNDFQRVGRNNDLIQYMGLNNGYIEPVDMDKARFGFIKYENNGENVEEFDVIIPVTVTYEWGDVLDEPVRIHIIRTMGN